MDELLKVASDLDINRGIAILAVVGFGVFAMKKVFGHMKDGFGIFNVRITGIVIVAALASILAVLNPSTESAAIGILGQSRDTFSAMELKIKVNIDYGLS